MTAVDALLELFPGVAPIGGEARCRIVWRSTRSNRQGGSRRWYPIPALGRLQAIVDAWNETDRELLGVVWGIERQ